MTKRSLDIVLDEMLDAIAQIERACVDKTLDDLESDWVLARAVERGLEIVSEASRHRPDEVEARYPDIPWHAVRGLGNMLRHEYHRVSSRIIWNVVTVDLPQLSDTPSRIAQNETRTSDE